MAARDRSSNWTGSWGDLHGAIIGEPAFKDVVLKGERHNARSALARGPLVDERNQAILNAVDIKLPVWMLRQDRFLPGNS